MNVIAKVRETIERYSLLQEGDRVVVGVSGGPDSTALLDILCTLREDYDLALIPSHLNHGFRPGEAEAERGFCRDLAARYGLSLVAESLDLPGLLRRRGGSPQALAREERYAFFRRVAEAEGASKIAVGHHAGDQAETLLMRLLRGAGTHGLSGIPVCREPGVIRPLMALTRREILAHLQERGLAFREDSSNRKDCYLRNRVRRELIPLLAERYNPNLVEDLRRTAEVLADEDAALQAEAERRFSPLPIPGGVALQVPALRELHPGLVRRVIRLALERSAGGLSGISYRHVEAVMRLMQARGSAASLDLPRGLKAAKVYDRLEFTKRSRVPCRSGRYEIAVPGSTAVPELGVKVESRVLPAVPDRICGRERAFLDLDRCVLPLWIRTRRPGDRFRPAGMEGSKKVKRYFIDGKVPAARRDRIPLLVDARDAILWIGGHRADGRFAADRNTSRVLEVAIRSWNGEAP